jgi:RNA polymerase sigma factor (TIGR02999 family)
VHEAYLRLLGQQPADWQSRAHFIAVAARLMRQILVDHARAHAAAKRRPAAALPLAEAKTIAPEPAPNLLALDEAMQALAQFDERKSRLIELRYFGGLEMDEMAEVTGLSVATIRRDLRMAEAWLGRQMQGRFEIGDRSFASFQWSLGRWEYWDGKLFDMSGASEAHYEIEGNLLACLKAPL